MDRTLVHNPKLLREQHAHGAAERYIFGRVRCGNKRMIAFMPVFFSIRSNGQTMLRVPLYLLQSSQSSENYAVVNGYRVTVDVAQASVHFYQGEQEWGPLAGSVTVEKWTGDWLIRAVGRFFRLDYQLSDNKALASVQRNGYLAVRTAHVFGNATVYERLLADSFWDYAVSFRGILGFGASVQKAAGEIRTQLQVRSSQERTTIVLQSGPNSRFDQQQLLSFCQANDLTPGGEYTQQQLRQAVLKQRKLNCERFRNQLHYFNIRINCK